MVSSIKECQIFCIPQNRTPVSLRPHSLEVNENVSYLQFKPPINTVSPERAMEVGAFSKYKFMLFKCVSNTKQQKTMLNTELSSETVQHIQ
jgi:hypothetical protein